MSSVLRYPVRVIPLRVRFFMHTYCRMIPRVRIEVEKTVWMRQWEIDDVTSNIVSTDHTEERQ